MLKAVIICAQVREVAIEAIERARRGDGPTLIEAQTYRFRGHSLADPDELREKKEKDYWQVHPSERKGEEIHYAFWRQFDGKPNIVPSCPGCIPLHSCMLHLGGCS